MKRVILLILLVLSMAIFISVSDLKAWQLIFGSGTGFEALDYCGVNAQGKGVVYAGSWASDLGVFRIEYDAITVTVTSILAMRDFTDFKPDPTDNNIVWGTNYTNYKIYKFSNALAVPVIEAKYTFPNRPINVAMDNSDSSKMLCATFGGFYRSTDSGTTWNLVHAGNPVNIEACWIVEHSPWNSDEYYVVGTRFLATEGGIYKYNFATDTYTYIGLEGQYTKGITFVSGSAQERYYVTCTDGKVYYYDGSVFTAKTAIPGTYAGGIANPDCDSGTLYGYGTIAKVQKSTDNGATWNAYSTGISCPIMDFTYDCTKEFLFASGQDGCGGIYMEKMNPATPTPTVTQTATKTATATLTVTVTPQCGVWQTVYGAGTGFEAVDYCGKNPQGKGIVFAGSWASDLGVFRIEYDDSGFTVVPVIAKRDFVDFKPDPSDNSIIWAPNYTDYKLYKITNAHGVPTVTAKYTFPNRPYNTAVDRSNSNKMVCATFGGFYRSTDGGTTWNLVDAANAKNTEACWQVEPSPWNSDEYFVIATKFNSTDKGGLYKYSFANDTYTYIGLENEYTKTISFEAASLQERYYITCTDGKIFYFNGSGFVSKTGITGTYTGGILNPACVVGNPLYAWGTTAKVQKSTDNGATWNAYNSGITCPIMDLSFDCDKGYIFAGGQAGCGGIYGIKICESAVNTPTQIPVVTIQPTLAATLTKTPTQYIPPTVVATYTQTAVVVQPSATSTIAAATEEPTPAITVTDDDTDAYPNPCSDHVKVVFNINKKSDIKIYVYSFNGKLVDTVDYSLGWTPNQKLYQIQLDVKKYVPGMYFYVIQGKAEDGEIINYKSKKFLIKR